MTTTPVTVNEPEPNSVATKSNKRKCQENTIMHGKSPKSIRMSNVHKSLNRKMKLEKEFINLTEYDIEENKANKAKQNKYLMSQCKQLLEKAGIIRNSV